MSRSPPPPSNPRFPAIATGPDRRIAPRPLPLHLLSHLATLSGSLIALPLLRHGSLPWKRHLADAAAEVRQGLAAIGPDAQARFERVLAAEAIRRHVGFLDGLELYRRHPYRRRMPLAPEIWRQGTTRLLDYRAVEPDRKGEGTPVLVVPSLVNRAYILDLSPSRSLMRSLAGYGLAPFLVDWDAPGPVEAGFDLTAYIVRRLEPMLDRVTALTGRPPVLLGYCMGGLLALALALRRPDAVSGLALMATPWDFHAGRPPAQTRFLREVGETLGNSLIGAGGTMAVATVQALFASLDPGLAPRKFAAFSRLDPASARARDFVALEDWANDGVPLAGPVARECLFSWYGANTPVREQWRVAGQPVRPQAIRGPTLVMVPERDRIVPPDSALPLASQIAGARLIRSAGGHVAMLTGPRARTDIYRPLARWLMARS